MTEFENIGLRNIAEGKLSVVLNASGISSSSWMKSPKILHRFGDPLNMSLLEFYLKRFKSLGRKAIEKYGRLFKDQREPIMVILMSNEKDSVKIEKFLYQNQYFNYIGILCIIQVS